MDTNSLIGTELSGLEFKRTYSNTNFYKLTNRIENHHEFQFHDGLNIDTNEFKPSGSCSKGGLYFVEENKVYKWIYYDICIGSMHYIRKVEIPDDARVYIENDKFKADKFILGLRNPISKDIYTEAALYKFNILNNIPQSMKDKDLCMKSVKKHGFSLRDVPNYLIDKEMCMEAVKTHGASLKYVPLNLIDREICMEAIDCYASSLEFVPDSFKDVEMCMRAFKNKNGGYHAISFIPYNFLKQVLSK